MRAFVAETALADKPAPDATQIARMKVGETFAVLECGRGLAWGYAEATGLVGYVDEDALA